MALVTPEFVFIHVPRTGGTSARSAILAGFPDALDSDGSSPFCGDAPTNDDCGVAIPPEQHIGASRLERRNPTLDQRFVGFVRHPLTWYASMWAWASKTNFGAKIATNPFAARHWLAAVWDDELGRFLDNVIAMQVPRAWVVFHEKLSRADGSMCEIGRYEALHADLFRLTGCSVAVRLRKSDEKNQIERSHREAIESLERETIRKFYGERP